MSVQIATKDEDATQDEKDTHTQTHTYTDTLTQDLFLPQDNRKQKGNTNKQLQRKQLKNPEQH